MVYRDTSRPVDTNSQEQTPDTRQATASTADESAPQIITPAPLSGPPPAPTSPSEQSASVAAVPSQQAVAAPIQSEEAASQSSAQQSRAETTAAAVREENRKNLSNGADNSSSPQATLASSHNRCDILACAGTYRSFRANDCTYQPFDGGARRLCEKSAGQRIVRERELPNRGGRNRDAEVRDADRAFVDRDAVEVDDYIREPTSFLDFIFLGRPSS